MTAGHNALRGSGPTPVNSPTHGGIGAPVAHLPLHIAVVRAPDRLPANAFRKEYRGAIEGLDRRQVACKALDLDRRKLARATLSERRGPDVAGEHIRVAMHA